MLTLLVIVLFALKALVILTILFLIGFIVGFWGMTFMLFCKERLKK